MLRTTFHFICVLRKDPALYVSAAVLALCFAIPLLFDEMVFGYEPIKMDVDSASGAMSQLSASGSLKDMPPDERAFFDKRAEALAQAVSASSRASFYRSAARFKALDLEQMDQGNQTTDLRVHVEAEYRFCREMSQGAHPDFDSSSRMPLVSHLSFAVSRIPAIIWFLPAFMFLLRVADLSRKNLLLSNLPVSSSRLFVARCLAGGLVVVLALLAAYAPSAILSLARNGLGDPARPVFFARDGALAVSSDLSCYVGAAGTLVLGNLFIVVVGLGVAAAVRSTAVGTAASLFCAAAPMIGGYYAAGSPLFGVLPLLPTSYLSVDEMPYSGCFPLGWGQAGLDGRLDPALGFATLALGALIVAAAALLVMLVRRRRCGRMAVTAEGGPTC